MDKETIIAGIILAFPFEFILEYWFSFARLSAVDIPFIYIILMSILFVFLIKHFGDFVLIVSMITALLYYFVVPTFNIYYIAN